MRHNCVPDIWVRGMPILPPSMSFWPINIVIPPPVLSAIPRHNVPTTRSHRMKVSTGRNTICWNRWFNHVGYPHTYSNSNTNKRMVVSRFIHHLPRHKWWPISARSWYWCLWYAIRWGNLFFTVTIASRKIKLVTYRHKIFVPNGNCWRRCCYIGEDTDAKLL